MTIGFPNRDKVECYAISVLQAIIHHPRFVEFLRYHHSVDNLDDNQVLHNAEGLVYCALCELYNLVTTVWTSSSSKKIREDEAKTQVEALMRRFREFVAVQDSDSVLANGEEQQDAGEFYHMLWTWAEAAFELFPDKITQDQCQRCALNQLLRLNVQAVFTCQECGTKSTQSDTEEHLTFGLNIPKGDASHVHELNDILPAAFEKPGDHGQCSNCGTECIGSKTNVISAQPDLLCFMVQADPRSTYRLHIPDDLDLDAYRGDQITSSLRYRLQAVIELWERDEEFGHYVAYTRIDDEWRLVNDKEVSRPAATYEQARLYMKGNRIFCPRLIYYALQYETGSMPPSPIAASADVSEPQPSKVRGALQARELPDEVEGEQSPLTPEIKALIANISVNQAPDTYILQTKSADPHHNRRTPDAQATSEVLKDRHNRQPDQVAPRDPGEAPKQPDLQQKCKRKREEEAGPVSTNKSARTDNTKKSKRENARESLEQQEAAKKADKESEQEKVIKVASEDVKGKKRAKDIDEEIRKAKENLRVLEEERHARKAEEERDARKAEEERTKQAKDKEKVREPKEEDEETEEAEEEQEETQEAEEERIRKAAEGEKVSKTKAKAKTEEQEEAPKTKTKAEQDKPEQVTPEAGTDKRVTRSRAKALEEAQALEKAETLKRAKALKGSKKAKARAESGPNQRVTRSQAKAQQAAEQAGTNRAGKSSRTTRGTMNQQKTKASDKSKNPSTEGNGVGKASAAKGRPKRKAAMQESDSEEELKPPEKRPKRGKK